MMREISANIVYRTTKRKREEIKYEHRSSWAIQIWNVMRLCHEFWLQFTVHMKERIIFLSYFLCFKNFERRMKKSLDCFVIHEFFLLLHASLIPYSSLSLCAWSVSISLLEQNFWYLSDWHKNSYFYESHGVKHFLLICILTSRSIVESLTYNINTSHFLPRTFMYSKYNTSNCCPIPHNITRNSEIGSY